MLGKKIFINFFSRVIDYGASIIALILITRVLDPEVLGQVDYFRSFIGLYAFVLNLGVDAAHTKRVSEGKDLQECLGAYLALKILLILLFVGTVLIVGIQRNIIQISIASGSLETWIFIFLLVAVILKSGLGTVGTRTFLAKREAAKEGWISIINGTVYLLSIIGLSLFIKSGLVLALALMFSSFISSAVAFQMVLRNGVARPTWSILQSYLTFTLPMLVASIAGTVGQNVNQFFIGRFVSDQEVAFYSVPNRLIMGLNFFSAAIMSLLYPSISALISAGDVSQVHSLIKRSLKYIGIIYWPMFGLVVFFGERVITLLFGPKYAPAGNVFILLFFFATLQSLSRPASAAILGNDLSRLYSLITISNVFLSVSFTMLLVPVEIMGIPTAGWGAEGAAVAKIVSGANSLLWLFIVLRKKINHQVSGRFLLPPGLVLLLVTGIFLINGGLHLQFTYSFLSLLRVFSLTAISLSAYLGLLVLLGEIQSEDIKFFRSVINPTEMKAYLVSELLE